MNDDHLARLVAVRVSVLLGRAPVRRPTRVSDAVISVERVQANAFLKVAELPFRTPKFKMLSPVDHRDARRIVTAIFELPEAVDDQRHDLFITNVPDNSAHNSKD